MSDEIDYSELDPDTIEARRREDLRNKRRRGALAEQAKVDEKHLMKDPAFRRWFFTVLGKAGIYQAAFLPQEGAAHYDAGRRGLGLELFNGLLAHDAKFAIDIAMEQAKLEEKLNEHPATEY